MRFVVITAFGLVLGYLQLGMVAVFGGIIMLTLGFLMNDVQDQTKQLTVVLKEHSELQVDEREKDLADLQGAVDTLRSELFVMAKALHAVHVELRTVTAVVVPKPKGPWEA